MFRIADAATTPDAADKGATRVKIALDQPMGNIRQWWTRMHPQPYALLLKGKMPKQGTNSLAQSTDM